MKSDKTSIQEEMKNEGMSKEDDVLTGVHGGGCASSGGDKKPRPKPRVLK